MSPCPCRYFETRSKAITTWHEHGYSPYPHKFHVDQSIPSFVAQWADKLAPGEVNESVTVSLAGRVMNARQQSAKLQFYDLHGEGAKVQVMVSAGAYKGAEGESAEKAAADFEWTRDNTKRGDIIGALRCHLRPA